MAASATATVAAETGETACGVEAHGRSQKRGAKVDSCTPVAAKVADDPLAFLDTKEPEQRVVLYASSERRAVVKYEIIGDAWQYSLEQLAGDKSLVRPTHVTSISFLDLRRSGWRNAVGRARERSCSSSWCMAGASK